MPHDPARGEDEPEHRSRLRRAVTSGIRRRRSRRWLVAARRPDRPSPVITDPAERRLVGTEVLVVLTVTLGLSALRSALSLIDALLQPVPLNEQQVALNAPAAQAEPRRPRRSSSPRVLQLVGWGALGGVPAAAGRVRAARRRAGRRRPGRDALGAAGLAALIGIPGLGLYLVAHALGVSVTIAPTTLDDTWWRLPVLIASAAGERLGRGGGHDRLPAHPAAAARAGRRTGRWLAAAVLRGSYHLYQGLGGFVGNLVMGLVFGRVWQRTNRLWCWSARTR